MKGLMIYSDNMEDGEALLTRDFLLRIGFKIDTVAYNKKEIVTAFGLSVFADYKYDEISLNEYNFLIIPGGKYVGQIIDKSKHINDVIVNFYERKKIIAAICAAPRFLGKLGLLNDKKFTCFPSCEIDMPKGIYLPNEKAVTDGLIITGRSVGCVVEFCGEIITNLLSKEAFDKLKKDIVL